MTSPHETGAAQDPHNSISLYGPEIALAVIIGCVVYLMVIGSGEFFYTLDDPYIHMALADNIKDGHYGINANEVSSPSSSILYPFILVPFSYFSIEKYAPLVINIFCTFVSLALLKKIISLILSDDPTLAVRMAWIAFFVLLMSNGIGVIFTGMEHSIQLLLCLFIILGVVRLSRSDTVPAYLCAACVLLPLIRFEGLALTSGTLMLLLYRKKFTPFLIVSSVLFAVLLGYGLYMNSLGLPMVPSSILVKISVNGAPANSSFLNSVFVYSVVNFILSLKHPSFIILMMTLFLIIASDGVVFRGRQKELKFFALYILFAHIFLGKYGFYSRYDAYIVLVAMILMIMFYKDFVLRLVSGTTPRKLRYLVGCVVLLLLHMGPYVLVTSPIASNNIFSQQYQMSRFVSEFWKKPIAVNDLGLVSYKNDQYVLDLWGLGSEKTRKLRMAQSENWMNDVVIEKKVDLAVIYAEWFEDDLPPSWVPVAKMKSNAISITPAEKVVTFYATSERAVTDLRTALRAFEKTVPANVEFKIR